MRAIVPLRFSEKRRDPGSPIEEAPRDAKVHAAHEPLSGARGECSTP
jgi:hypothetical protein